MSDSEEGMDPAIAAAMGFSSFGGAPVAKKRKFNDQSFVEGQEAEAARHQYRTGANDTALGERRPPKKSTDSDVGGGKPAASLADENTGGKAHDKKKAKGKGKDLQSGGLAAFLSHGQSLPARPSGVGAEEEKSQTATVQVGAEAVVNRDRMSGNAAGPVDFGSCSLQDLRRGVPNENGDMAYFLPSFLEDPWTGLE